MSGCKDSGAACDERAPLVILARGASFSVHPSEARGPSCQAWPGYHRPALWSRSHVCAPGRQTDCAQAFVTPHSCEGELL